MVGVPEPNAETLRIDLLRRLVKAEGQVLGIERMLAAERPCSDVLAQIQTAREALRQVSKLLLGNHAGKVAVDADERFDAEGFAGLMDAIRRFG